MGSDWSLFRQLFKPHPWHGVSIGQQAPEIVNCYIEIVPSDTVKYEADRISGYLRLDRPQQYSNVCPTLYGFIPQTFCGDAFGRFSAERLGEGAMRGDRDPLDICVFTERDLTHGDILLEAIPLGGMQTVDRDEADDKIVAVLAGDGLFGEWKDIAEFPPALVERLKHYFLTYKQPGTLSIPHVYGRETAHEVIRRAHEEYKAEFADLYSYAEKLRTQRGRSPLGVG